jgi:hypothetical protein
MLKYLNAKPLNKMTASEGIRKVSYNRPLMGARYRESERIILVWFDFS